MCQCELWTLGVLFACVCVVTTFNVDSFNYASYDSPVGGASMFGFSVALHRESNNGWLLVGAPEAQSSFQREVYRGGAVYKCPTGGDGNCQEIRFDTKADNLDSAGNALDNKTEQWFGATVSSASRAEGPIVACAPRYTWFPKQRTRIDPVGTCYVSDGFFRTFNEYSPCRTYQWGYHRQGSCQAGFSAAINSIGDRLFIGSPGSWYWQGQMYSIDAHATFDFKPSVFAATYGHEGQVHQQSLETRPAVFATTAGTEQDDDSYMGYSTIVGDFVGNGEEGIAVGMPRGNDLRGKVLLFTWNLTNFLHHFTSDQIGSYYGYALAGSDVDGDGKVDLIVGAPMYTVQNNKDKYDVGRVYVVYHQSKKGKFEERYEIDGFNSKSRFGQALASLGDINQDGYGDFAVGAPYDGKDNRGAVYIYHGSETGVRKTYSQVIFAEDLSPLLTGALTTFGFSITGGLDLDGNEYPDMAVGAYLSDKAFFFRSRPVVKVDAYVQFLGTSKYIDLAKPNHVLRGPNGIQAVKTQIQFCSRYYGKGIPSSLKLDLQYTLDSKNLLNPRMGFVDDEGQSRKNDTITLLRDVNIKCGRPIDVYVRTNVRDKLTALVVEVKYWMKDDLDLLFGQFGESQQYRDPRSILTPVLDLNSPPVKTNSTSIFKNCGDDDICIPDLSLKVSPSVEQYLLVSGEDLNLEITVYNTGDDAFESTVQVKYPDSLFFGSSEDLQVESHVLCSLSENSTLTCEIGNPVPRDKIVKFRLSWQPNFDKELVPAKYEFFVSVNSTNPEPADIRHNNVYNVTVTILNDFKQELLGKSIPSELFFNASSSQYTADISNQSQYTFAKNRLSEDVIGPQVTHVYHLKNEGRTTISETEIFFIWPKYTLAGEDFLYLVDPPHFSSTDKVDITCEDFQANYRDFQVIGSQKTIWERLSIDVDSVDSSSATSTGTAGGTKSTAITGWQNQTFNSNTSWVSGSRTEDTTVEIYQGDDVERQLKIEGLYRKQRSGGRDFIYRCFKGVNGRKQNVACSDFLSDSALTLLLQKLGRQQQGNIGYVCLEPTSRGSWTSTNCQQLPEIQQVRGGAKVEWERLSTDLGTERVVGATVGGTIVKVDETINKEVEVSGDSSKVLGIRHEKDLEGITVQIVREGEQLIGGANRYRKIQGSNLVYRCLRVANGREEQVDCGSNIAFSSANVTGLWQQSGLQHQGNIQYRCLEIDGTGKWRSVECEAPPTQTRVQQDITVQLVEGGADLVDGAQRYTRLTGSNFVYRCLRRINGREEEVECDPNLSLSGNAARFLQQAALERTGNVQYGCIKTDKTGNWRSVECERPPLVREYQPPPPIDTTTRRTQTPPPRTFGQDTGARRTEAPPPKVSGQLHAQGPRQDVTVQVVRGGEDVVGGAHKYTRVDGSNFVYRCLRRINGEEEEVDCGSNFAFSRDNITQLLQQAGFETRGNVQFSCLEADASGKWRSVECEGPLPVSAGISKTYETFVDVKRRCLKLVIDRWVEVDCSSDPRFETGGDNTLVQQCFASVNGSMQSIPCAQVRHHLTQQVGAGPQYSQQSGRGQYQGGSQYNQQSGSQQSGQSQYQDRSQYNQHSGSQSQGKYDETEYDYEDEDEQESRGTGYGQHAGTVSGGQSQGRRDPHTYGSYGGSRNRGVDGLDLGNTAFGGSGLTNVVLDVTNTNRRRGEPYSERGYNTVERDNVPTDAPTHKNWHHGRKRRQTQDKSHLDIEKEYPCQAVQCTYKKCTLRNLKHNKPLHIALRGRLNVRVLRKMTFSKPLNFSSVMVARVVGVPHMKTLQDQKPVHQEAVTWVQKTEGELKADVVPLWVVVLSAVAGTIILLLLVYLLYKFGFFKRNRPSSAPERQPLNRNGYHQGDEAL